MCQKRDIIFVYNTKYNNRYIGSHPFLVIDDTKGKIEGIDFDFVGLLLSSYSDDDKKSKLSKYETNFPITAEDKQNIIESFENKDSYLKAEQFIYFSKTKTKYIKVSELPEDLFDLVIDFIYELREKGITFEQYIGSSKNFEN